MANVLTLQISLFEVKTKNVALFNPSMHNVVKWPNILSKSCGVNTARVLKYVWPFYNITHEKVNNRG